MTTPTHTPIPPLRNPRPFLAALAVLLVVALALLALCLRGPGGGGGGGTGSGTGTGNGAGSPEPPGGDGSVPAAAMAEQAGAPPATPAVESPVAAAPTPMAKEGPPVQDILLTSAEKQGADAAAGAGGAAGGQRGRGLGTGDLSFRLYWKPPQEDLDLHVTDPKGHRLGFKDPTCPCSGKMDRDDTIEGGPENIFWPRGAAPRGVYKIRVEYYAGTGPEQFTVEVRRKDQVTETLTGTLQNKGEQSQEFAVTY